MGSEMCIRDRSLVLSIDVCRGLGMSPLRINIWLSFSQADLDPTSAQALLFFGFLKSLELFFRRFAPIASGTEIFWRVSLKFYLFMETSRFHCHRYHGPTLVGRPGVGLALAGQTGQARQIFRGWAAARPGPSNFQRMGRGPAQLITFSKIHGPARPGASFFQTSWPCLLYTSPSPRDS